MMNRMYLESFTPLYSVQVWKGTQNLGEYSWGGDLVNAERPVEISQKVLFHGRHSQGFRIVLVYWDDSFDAMHSKSGLG